MGMGLFSITWYWASKRLKPRAIRLIQDLDIPAADKDKIFWRNARALLKLH